MRGRFASKRENHALICAPGLFVSSGLPLLADSQSILQGVRHFESFNRLLNSVFLIGCLNRSEMFSSSADYIDTPSGHRRNTFPVRLGSIGAAVLSG